MRKIYYLQVVGPNLWSNQSGDADEPKFTCKGLKESVKQKQEIKPEGCPKERPFLHPFQVSWHIVFSGIFLQVVLGFVILRWNSGFRAFEWFAEQAVIFLDYTDAGSTFVFGSANDPESWRNHEFLMKVEYFDLQPPELNRRAEAASSSLKQALF